MRRLAVIVVAFILLTGGSARSGMFDDVSDALLFNSFNSVRVIDSFAIATSPTGVAALRLDPLTGHFHAVDFLSLLSEPVSSKVCGNVLVVRTFSNIVYFVDLTNLPDIALLGRIDLGFEFYDMVYSGERLFVAAGFNGLKQYQLTETEQPVLVDSSLNGVHCVQVDVYGNDLLLLDDYNGILRYDISDGILGQPDEKLFLPRQALSFCRLENRLAIPLLGRSLVYWADAETNNMTLVDSLSTTIIATEGYLVDTLLVLVNGSSRILEARSTLSSVKTLVSLPLGTPAELDGGVYFEEGDYHLLYPTAEFGLAQFNLTDIWFDAQPSRAYDHPGPVTTLSSHDSMLLTGGVGNPLEVYSLDAESHAVLETNFAGLDHVGPICDGGNRVFAYYSGLKQVLEFDVGSNSVNLVTQFTPSRVPKKMRYFDYPPVDSLGLLMLAGDKVIDLYGITADGRIKSGVNPSPQTLGSILDLTVVDSFLVVTTADRQLYWFRLFGGLNATLWGSISTTGAFDHITATGERPSFGDWTLSDMVLAFEGNNMYQVSILYSGPAYVNYITTLPVPVTNSVRGLSDLFTTGPMGLGRIDLRYSIPQLVDYGGYAGGMIAYADSTVAVSDGSGVFLYRVYEITPTGIMETPPEDLMLDNFGLVNYPNPFNPSTRISFSLSRAADVELTILNIIGQRVVTLVEGRVEEGVHSVTWTGTDAYGRRVASGVYLYRLSTPEGAATRKMILLR